MGRGGEGKYVVYLWEMDSIEGKILIIMGRTNDPNTGSRGWGWEEKEQGSAKVADHGGMNQGGAEGASENAADRPMAKGEGTREERSEVATEGWYCQGGCSQEEPGGTTCKDSYQP